MLRIKIDNQYDSQYHYFQQELKTAIKAGQRVLVLVPEQYTLDAERELLKITAQEALFRIEVSSIKRLVQKLLNNNLAEDMALTSLGKKLLIAEIIDKQKNNLAIYKEAGSIIGILDKLSDLIADFRQEDVSVEQLTGLAHDLGEDNYLALKLKEIALIYSAYLQRLGEDCYDEATQLKRAIEQLKKTDRYLQTIVIVESFSSMTKLEQEFIFALSKRSKAVNLRIIGERKLNSVYNYSEKFINNFLKNAQNSGVPYQIDSHFVESSVFVKSFQTIFDYQQIEEQAIKTYAFETMDSEIEYTFMRMLAKHKNDGLAWRDMAILTGDLSSYYPQIKRLAKRYKIPVFTDARRAASTHFAVDFILMSLKAINNNLAAREVIKVLKTDFFQLPEEAVFRAENTILARGVSGNAWLQEWGEEEEQRLAVLPAIESLFALKSNLKKATTVQTKIRTIRDYLASNHFAEQIAEQSNQQFTIGNYEKAEELAQIYNVIDKVFYQLYILGEQTRISNLSFYQLLKIGFDQSEIGIMPNADDYVICGNIRRTRLSQIKELYIIGMTEKSLPSSDKNAQLFNEAEALLLQNNGLDCLNSVNDSYEEEVYKTYENIAKTENAVYMLCTDSDVLGQKLKASLWFSELATLGQLQRPSVDLEKMAEYGLSSALANQIIHHYLAGKELSDALLAKFKYLCQVETGLTSFLKAEEAVNENAKISSEQAIAIYGSDMALSISRLESFAHCPFKHFVDYGLKPMQLQEPSLNAMEAGSFYHSVLEYCFNHLSSLNNAEQEIDKLVAEAVLKYKANHFRFQLNPQNSYYCQRLTQALSPALRALLAHYQHFAFKNYKNEYYFEGIPLKHTKATIRGVIDRIDLFSEEDNNYLQVIDYKSSKHSISLGEIYYGVKLQLMIYLKLAQQEVSQKLARNYQNYGAFYFNLSVPNLSVSDEDKYQEEFEKHYKLNGYFINDVDSQKTIDRSLAETGKSKITLSTVNKDGSLKVNNKLLKASDMELISDYALDKASRLAAEIYSGEIAVKPSKHGEETACTFCEYKTICQFDVQRQAFNYRHLPKIKDDDKVLEKMGEELEHGKD